MAYEIAFPSDIAVSFPYAYIGGAEPVTVIFEINWSDGSQESRQQTVTFDDPLPEEPDALVFFTNEQSLKVKIIVSTPSQGDINLAQIDELNPYLRVVRFGQTPQNKDTVLILFICKER